MKASNQYRGIKTVAILRGGPSHEYDISLRSGANIIQSLPENIVGQDIFISRDGEWHVGGVTRSPERILRHFDLAINALHGDYGEDGKVQKTLELFGIPYTGSRPLGSALAMNKELTKRTLKSHGLKVPEHIVVRKGDLSHSLVREIFRTFPQPSIVKPSTGGSSLGVFLAYDFKTLLYAIEKAMEYSPTVLVEEYITGKEISCGVMEGSNREVYSLYPTEMIYGDSQIFDYDSKYSNVENKVCPSSLNSEEKTNLQKMAIKAHQALGLRHYSIADFIVSPKRGVFVIEVNSLPGLTKESIYPKSLQAVGIDFSDFIDHITELAIEG